jgi:ribosomal protein S17E
MNNKRILILMVIISSFLLLANQLGSNSTQVFFVAQAVILVSALLLWRLTLSTVPEAVVGTENDKSEGMSEVDDKIIHSVIFELQQFLHQEVLIVENEIKRTALLVEEAVVGLSESFKSLQGLSNEQQQMIQLIMKSKTDIVNINETDSLFGFIEEVHVRLEKFMNIIDTSKQNLEELSYTDEISHEFEHVIGLLADIKAKKLAGNIAEKDMSSQEITHEFNEAKALIDELINITPRITEAVFLGIRSLQFEDLTRQSLESLNKNVINIHTISDVLVQFNEPYSGSVHQQLVNLKSKCEEVYLVTKAEEEKRSVKQLSMEEGEVDLF